MQVDMAKLTNNNYVLLILLCLFTCVALSGCYSSEVVKSANIPSDDIPLITKIGFKDGTTLDFKEFENRNTLLTIDKENIVYKNPAGIKHSISSNEIARYYKDILSPWKTVVFIIGTAAAAALLLLKF